MGGGDKTPDPAESAQAQAQANRINQITPFGNLTFSGDDRSTATTTLSPEVQAVIDQQLLAAALSGQTGTARLGQLGAGRGAVEQATYDRALALINPELERHEAALRQRLANQGLPQTSGAFGAELGRFESGRADQLENLALSSVLAGGAEETRAMNIIASLLGLTQAQQPTFFSPGGVTVPIGGGGGGISPFAGAATGALSGAASGAAIGAAFGGVGAIPGAIGGGLIGGLGGYGATR